MSELPDLMPPMSPAKRRAIAKKLAKIAKVREAAERFATGVPPDGK